MNHFLCLFFTTISLLIFHPGIGQKSPDSSWKFLIEPYIMFPNMKGETSVRNLPAVEVDAKAGDIFSKLQFGAMLYLEARNYKWAITLDFLYMDLKQDATPNIVIKSGVASAKQLGVELAGLYRLVSYLEAGIGIRLNHIKSGLDIVRNTIGGGTQSMNATLSRSWVDPVIILRTAADVNDKWLFTFRGDVGGFGIGSKFTWQIQAYVGYRFSKLFQASTGYRILGIDYDKGSGNDRFQYDMSTFGPNIRLGFNL